jgi:hypothetical protein
VVTVNVNLESIFAGGIKLFLPVVITLLLVFLGFFFYKPILKLKTDRDALAGKKKNSTILLSVSFFVLTLLLFSAARIYITNFKEFSYVFHESMLFFLILSLVLILILSTALLLLSRYQKTIRTIVSVLFVTAFLMWFQGNIFLWQYGVLDGNEIEWNTLVYYGIIDSVFWALVITFSILRTELVLRISRVMSLFFIILQFLSVFQIWISMPKNQSFRQQEVDSNTQFLFSKHVNVIVLVLDTFQSDIFQDIVQEDADLKASFDGFTYFRNSLAGSDGTSVSIPNMLTGNNYDNATPYLEFVKQSFLGNSLPKTLKEYSFRIDLFPIIPYSVYNDFSGIALQSKRIMNWDAFFREQAFIADLALFRDLPHFIKEIIYNHQRWFFSGLLKHHQDTESGKQESSEISNAYNLKYSKEFENSKKLIKQNRDANFINRMIPMSGVVEKTDTFKLYHLNGIHLQLIMDENLEYEELKPTRANMKRQGAGILKIAAMFLERLKQMKVYDNSLIFIIGDHGSGMSDANINISSSSANFNKRGPYKGFFKSFKTAGIPLILVKRMDSKGELKISDAPVSLGDIPETAIEELGLKGKFPGKSMFRVKEDEKRERIYRAFFGEQENVEYLAPLYEYSVNGFSWDDTSWQETGNIYYAKKNK